MVAQNISYTTKDRKGTNNLFSSYRTNLILFIFMACHFRPRLYNASQFSKNYVPPTLYFYLSNKYKRHDTGAGTTGPMVQHGVYHVV